MHNKRIICLVLSILMAFSAFAVNISAAVAADMTGNLSGVATPDEATPDETTPDEVIPDEATEDEATYDELVLRRIIADYITERRGDIKLFDSTYDEVTYDVVYSYYGTQEATPDYVLVDINFMSNCSSECGVEIGDYIITNDAWYGLHPAFVLGYFVIQPESASVYTLENAFNQQIEGVDAILTESGVARRIGDTNNDGKFDINDATYIQKVLADFEGYENDVYRLVPRATMYYYADFDGNGKVNIKDVTNLQKCLAGFVDYHYRYDGDTKYDSVPVSENVATVDYVEVEAQHFGYNDSYRHSYNKLITSVVEYEAFFHEKSDVYNELFFETNSMVYIYRWYGSGSYDLRVNGVSVCGDTLYVDCSYLMPPPDWNVTDDIGVYENYIIVDKAQVGEINSLVIDEGIEYYYY